MYQILTLQFLYFFPKKFLEKDIKIVLKARIPLKGQWNNSTLVLFRAYNKTMDIIFKLVRNPKCDATIYTRI